MNRDLVLIINDVRSCHNVGSLLRTADGLGVEAVYMTGYTPYPWSQGDDRLPHLTRSISARIHKTALGAENTVKWERHPSLISLIRQLKEDGYLACALEQSGDSIKINRFKPPKKAVLLLGREVEGLDEEFRSACDVTLEIPMLGAKESLNVVQAAAIALYHLRYAPL